MVKRILSPPVPLDGDSVNQEYSLEAVQDVSGGTVIKYLLTDALESVEPIVVFHLSCTTLIVTLRSADVIVIVAGLSKIV